MDESVATFIGLVLSKDGGSVEYQIDRVLHVDDGEELNSAGPLTVDYWDGDARYLSVGDRYRVSVWSDRRPSPKYASGVHRAGENCGGGGTLHADGSSIDTALTLLGIQLWPTGVLAACVLAGALVVFASIRGKRRAEVVR
jgi:hypothetical protein